MTNSPAAVRLKKSRTALLLDAPFFGTLLFRLKEKPCHSIKTMATDGVHLFYNPDFVQSLTPAELNGVLAHEVMHPALQHHTRRGDRSPKRWNLAADFCINPMILDAGLTLPKGALYDPRFRNMSAERIYNLIAEEEDGDSGTSDQSQAGSGGGAGNTSASSSDSSSSDSKGNEGKADQDKGGEVSAPDTAGGFGQVLDAPNEDQPGEAASSEQIQAQELDWKIAVQQAEVIAKAQGRLPAGAERAVEQADTASVNWREALRRAFSATIPTDFSWSQPNRRHLWSGIYLPGVRKEGVGEIAIAVDCSGSISARQLGLFEAEIQAILAEQPSRVHVLYFDAVVLRTEVFEQGQPIKLQPIGGGGTDFCPVFSTIDELGILPQTLIFLTDLYGTFPTQEPPYPVIWAATESREAPFGETIPMSAA